MFKPDYTTNFNNHVSYCLPPYKVYNVTGLPSSAQDKDWFIPVTERLLENSELRLNHYRTQSFEFYTEVKMRRGDSQHETNDRCVQSFYDSDTECNDVYDTTLRTKKKRSFTGRTVVLVLCLLFVVINFCVWY